MKDVSSLVLALYLVAAAVMLIGGIVDHPRFSVTRCIAVGLGLMALAQVVK